MPYVSHQQRKYFNANRKELESQGVDVDHWNDESRGKKLPKKKTAAFLMGERLVKSANRFMMNNLFQGLGSTVSAFPSLRSGSIPAESNPVPKMVPKTKPTAAPVTAATPKAAGALFQAGRDAFKYAATKESLATGIGAILGALNARKGQRLRGAGYGAGIGTATDTGMGIGGLAGLGIGGLAGSLIGAPGGPANLATGASIGAGLGTLGGALAGGYGGYRAGREISKDVGKGSGRGEPWDKETRKKNESDTEKESSGMPIIKTEDAMARTSHYINYLATKASQEENSPLHIKQARANRLTKLSQALHEKRNILEAIKIAYPEKTEAQRFKLARQLVRGVAARRKAAARKESNALMGYGNDASVADPGAAGAASDPVTAGGVDDASGVAAAPSFSQTTPVV